MVMTSIVLHVFVSVLLTAAVLIQSGRGGGLSQAFGGGATQTIFGTRANAFLVRTTTVLAVLFFLTSLSLIVLVRRERASLMDSVKIEEMAPVAEAAPKE